LTERSPDSATSSQIPPQERTGADPLARALTRARWTIFWERLWPGLASVATVAGLFLALSWLGLWLWLGMDKGRILRASRAWLGMVRAR